MSNRLADVAAMMLPAAGALHHGSECAKTANNFPRCTTRFQKNKLDEVSMTSPASSFANIQAIMTTRNRNKFFDD